MKPFGILLTSGGSLAESLLALCRSVWGELANVGAVTIEKEDDWESSVRKIQEAVQNLDQGEGVLVLSDVKGSTPFNVAKSLRGQRPMEVLGGVNLPMVLKAIRIAGEMNLSQAAILLEQYGKEHIVRAESENGEKRG